MLFVIREANYIGTEFVSTWGKLSTKLTDEGLYLNCAVIYKCITKTSPHPSASRPPSPEGEGVLFYTIALPNKLVPLVKGGKVF